MRGPKPKPAEIRAGKGDTCKLGANKFSEKLASEPKAARGLTECPDHLTGLARSTWDFWAAEIEYMGLDRRPDGMMLEGACVGYARAVKADLQLEKQGLTFKNEDGVIKKHPAVEISRAAWAQCRAFATEFGLSPAARARLTIDKKEEDTDLMELLSAPREPRVAVN